MAALILSSSSPRGALGLGNPARVNFMSTGTGPVCIRGCHDRHVNLYSDRGTRRVVDFPDQVLGDDGSKPNPLVIDGSDGPGDLGDVGRDEAVDILREHFNQLGAALVRPHLGSGDFFAVIHHQRIGDVGIGIGFRFIVVGVVGRVFVSAETGTQRLDAKLVHHVLVILVGSKGNRRWRRCRILTQR